MPVLNAEQQITSEEQELRKKILDTAQHIFLSKGVRSVTMDDLASELGVSKKTVYRFIDNKAELVHQCVQRELVSSQAKVTKINKAAGDAIEEMLLMGTMVIEMLSSFNANTIFELQKFYQESWLLVERHHREFVLNVIKKNLEKGIIEGLYRPEINVEVLSRIYIHNAKAILDLSGDGSQDFNPSDVYMEFFSYHIRGIASPKGVEKLAIYKNKIKLTI